MGLAEILPGVWSWSWFAEHKGYDFNGYLVEGVCVDPVEMDDPTLERIAAMGIERIVVTNRNHTRAANRVRARTGAKVCIHAADAAFASERNGTPADEPVAPGDRIGPFQVLPVPGKSPGEVALHWAERRVLIVGDACVGSPPGSLSLLPAKVIDDVDLLRQSLSRLAEDVDFEALLPGDGVPIVAGGRIALRALVARAGDPG